MGSIGQTTDKNCRCPKGTKFRKQQSYSLLLGIIIAILPKCPFCAFGYSSVMVLCSGARFQNYTPAPQSFLPIAVAIAVVISLLWNFRGRRTWWALALALAGSLLVTQAQRISGDPQAYYAGAALIFSGVFVNGALLPFWRKWTKYRNK